MPRRKVRDTDGNWVYEDYDEPSSSAGVVPGNDTSGNKQNGNRLKLDWRDWVALAIASLETIFVPVIVVVVTMAILAVLFVHL